MEGSVYTVSFQEHIQREYEPTPVKFMVIMVWAWWLAYNIEVFPPCYRWIYDHVSDVDSFNVHFSEGMEV